MYIQTGKMFTSHFPSEKTENNKYFQLILKVGEKTNGHSTTISWCKNQGS